MVKFQCYFYFQGEEKMRKEWKKPEIKKMNLQETKSGDNKFYWPLTPECDDPANTGEGYQMCKYLNRPCKYFGIFAGGSIAECNAPSIKQLS